ncbi:MAG: hypothetical protein R3Y08_00295 [Rikenellaceae bacterium]
MIEIIVESNYIGYSRYDTIVVCGGFDTLATQLYLVAAHRAQGENFVRLEAKAASSIETIIYFIPQITPQGKNEPIVDHPPFEAQITIKNGSKILHNRTHQINSWGGAAIKLNFEL